MNKKQKLSKVGEWCIKRMEEGQKNKELPFWTKGWNGIGSQIPTNFLTKKAYSGLNCYLTFQAMDKEYQVNQWGTYNQIIQSMGLKKTKKGLITEDGKKFEGNILKKLPNGERQKASPVEFWTIKYRLKDEPKFFSQPQYDKLITNGDYESDDFYKFLTLGGVYYVFNIEQTNLELPKPPKRKEYKPNDSKKLFDEIIKGFEGSPSVEIRAMANGESPHYTPTLHKMVLPLVEQYQSNNEDKGHLHWFKTAMHETGHSTGHEKILARDGVVNLEEWEGHEERYAQEELVAEMFASQMMDWYGFNYKGTIENTQAYLNGWYSRLKDDPTILINAMRQSNKAIARVLNIK